jgi:hypothetical protein
VRHVVVLLNSSLAITCGFPCDLCMNLRHSLFQLLNLHKLLRVDKVQRYVDRHIVLQHQRQRDSLRVSSEGLYGRPLVQPRR